MKTDIEWLTLFENKHGKKYKYTLPLYRNIDRKIAIVCPSHGVFYQSPQDHSRCGCAKCSGHNLTDIELKNIFLGLYPNDEYSYKTPFVKDDNNRIQIRCNIHGNFFQSISNHKQGHQGCEYCSSEYKKRITSISDSDWLERFEEVHQNTYIYQQPIYWKEDVFGRKLQITCRKHGVFWQNPSRHTKLKYGCPVCKSSLGEKNIHEILTDIGVQFYTEHSFTDFRTESGGLHRFDFWIPSLKLIIEYDGIQHFEPVEFWGGQEQLNLVKSRDKEKDTYCYNNKYNIVRVSYLENNISSLINSAINH